MKLDWHTLDRWMMGEAWIGSSIEAHLDKLCQEIGPRWSSSEAEWAAIHYLREQMERAGLEQVSEQTYTVDTWSWSSAEARVVRTERIDAAKHQKTNGSQAHDFWGVAVQFIGRPTVDLATAMFGSEPASS